MSGVSLPRWTRLYILTMTTTDFAGPPDNPPGPAVSLRHVCLGYEGEWVLHDVTLDIPKGAFLPFVGPNGGGKTTLLRAVLGLLPADGGVISFGDPDARLGYVPQQKTIDPLFPVTVLDIVMMVFYRDWGWMRLSQRANRARALDALATVGLADAAHKNYRELSGGMKQKALIARALASGADILVLDEPTSELDAPSEQDIVARLLQLNQQQGKTVLVACHGTQTVLSVAPQACVVEHGRAVIVDASEAHRFIATMAPTECCTHDG